MTIDLNATLVRDLSSLGVVGKEQCEQLFDALARLTPQLYPFEAITDAIEQSVTSAPPKLAEILNGILYLAAITPEPVEEILGAICNRLSQESISPAELDNIKYLLEGVFSNKELFASIKGTSLFDENERLFFGSKILTDLRPIFSNGNKEEVLGAMLVQQLKLVWQDSTGSKEMTIYLREEHIDQLLSNIERAKRKAQAVRATVGESFGKLFFS